jgi:hypothetical protein
VLARCIMVKRLKNKVMISTENLKVGDVLVCRGKSWVSKAIMKVTKGSYSHTALYAQTWNQSGVIEAQKNGVNFKLWDIWRKKWDYEFVVYRRSNSFDEKELMLKAFSKCGETKYDFFTFFRRAFGNRKKRNDEKENEKMICSEFTAWCHGLPEAYDMTPSEQADYFDKSKEWLRIY